MARLAVANGITHAVMTPHIHPGRYDNDRQYIAAVWRKFRAAIKSERIPLEIGMAAEVRVSAEVIPMIADEQIPFLGEWQGERVLLLEFPHSHILPGSDKLIDHLLKRNIRSMIAHPERNKDVMRSLDKLRPLVEAGCLLQVTAGSVAGEFGLATRERAYQMLTNGWVTLLASDAHDIDSRPPDLESGRRAAAGVVGEAESWRLVRDMPAALAAMHFGEHN